MGRGWKIAIGIVVVLAVLLGLNALLVDGETGKAEVTVPGGRLLDLPGGEIQVVEGGQRNGSPIVLIHCFTCGIDWWDRMRPALERRHRVIAVDLLGHDGSEKPGSGYSIPDQAAVVTQALRRLGVRKAEVVGHSLGGVVAVALAETAPAQVGRVVIIDTAPDHSRGSLGFLASLLFDPVIGEALWETKTDSLTKDGLSVAFAPGYDVPDQFVDDVNRMTYTAYDESRTQSDDYVKAEPLDQRMRETRLPLMVLMGAEEQIIDDPAGALAEYAKVVPGVQTHLIAGSGHSPNVEKPAQTAGLVLAFGNRASGVRSATGNQ